MCNEAVALACVCAFQTGILGFVMIRHLRKKWKKCPREKEKNDNTTGPTEPINGVASTAVVTSVMTHRPSTIDGIYSVPDATAYLPTNFSSPNLPPTTKAAGVANKPPPRPTTRPHAANGQRPPGLAPQAHEETRSRENVQLSLASTCNYGKAVEAIYDTEAVRGTPQPPRTQNSQRPVSTVIDMQPQSAPSNPNFQGRTIVQGCSSNTSALSPSRSPGFEDKRRSKFIEEQPVRMTSRNPDPGYFLTGQAGGNAMATTQVEIGNRVTGIPSGFDDVNLSQSYPPARGTDEGIYTMAECVPNVLEEMYAQPNRRA